MRDQLENLAAKTRQALVGINDLAGLSNLETDIFGRKNGELTNLLKNLKNLPSAERKTAGELANKIKNEIEGAISQKRQALQDSAWAGLAESEKVDITQPALPPQPFGHELKAEWAESKGHLHPITIIQRELEDLFSSMGFMVLDGPELESDYYNFTALNFPPHHPAREMQDTFYVKGHPDWLMRTHTSPMQVRAMQKYGAPIRALIPGRCFRNESTDPRHEHTLYHAEGLMVGGDITLAHLKGVLEAVAQHLYGPNTKLRVRPKHYPFVEPGINGEVTCFLCQGEGCRVCKQSGWLEIFGAGMVHPHVLKEGKVDPGKFQGFAFGLGLERLAMLKYGIDDVRLFESGEMRFLEQF